jgi:oligopeptide/dipeptide ABC transporter ATP-binding protein
MYLGRIVEEGTAEEVYDRPRHPYTDALLSAVPDPVPDPERRSARVMLQGDVPSPLDPPPGCHFHTRCPRAAPECAVDSPLLRTPDSAPGHAAACHFPLLPAPGGKGA